MLSPDIRPANRVELPVYKVEPLSGTRRAAQEKGIEPRGALENYARVALRVNSYKVRAEGALNHHARNAEYALRGTEHEPLYHFEIATTCTGLEERAPMHPTSRCDRFREHGIADRGERDHTLGR
jgi:hypothetical protein